MAYPEDRASAVVKQRFCNGSLMSQSLSSDFSLYFFFSWSLQFSGSVDRGSVPRKPSGSRQTSLILYLQRMP